VRQQPAGGDAALDDLRHARGLLEHLAVPARPLAVDVAVHEELGRHDVQPLGDVFTDALHGPPAAVLLAVGAVGLVVVLDTAQMFGQCIAAGLARRRLGLGAGGRCGGLSFAAQPFELRAQAGLVLGQRLLEQAPLVGAHGLGLRAVGPALQARQLEVDLLDLGLAQRDLAVLALQQRVALGQRLVDARTDCCAWSCTCCCNWAISAATSGGRP
jgi:hypothetical protein